MRLHDGSIMYAKTFIELSEEETARSFDFKEGVAEETRTRPNLVNENAKAYGQRLTNEEATVRQLVSSCSVHYVNLSS